MHAFSQAEGNNFCAFDKLGQCDVKTFRLESSTEEVYSKLLFEMKVFLINIEPERELPELPSIPFPKDTDSQLVVDPWIRAGKPSSVCWEVLRWKMQSKENDGSNLHYGVWRHSLSLALLCSVIAPSCLRPVDSQHAHMRRCRSLAIPLAFLDWVVCSPSINSGI